MLCPKHSQKVKQTLSSGAQICWLFCNRHFNLKPCIDSAIALASKWCSTSEIAFLGRAHRCRVNQPFNHSQIFPARRHLPNWEPAVCCADIFSATVSQTNMSLALDVSLSPSTSIVDVSSASLRKAGVGRKGAGSQMFVLFQSKQMFSRRIHTRVFTHTHMHSVSQCLGSLCTAVLFVVGYQLKTEGEIFNLESLQTLKVCFLVLIQPLWLKLMVAVTVYRF